ncbi:ankyrin repeat-containing domain protein [Microdochium trichocladiopsis]|uniref:Ankyrin repeat-containing domain protein n=1 Tax=Microdochium trichocladiopsis TaxID=1682393 RepID=A0A9P8XZG5_9PEZI|nr:ankyrin repeat-containing domain protein [Microdochium trichocladiopsis]KAH7024493.1 ankyrin repeat-containing domain protein [Microdochium trichocladiopsis]
MNETRSTDAAIAYLSLDAPPAHLQPAATICDLPPELIPLIAIYLPTRDALALAATNRLYQAILNDSIYARHIRTEVLGDRPLWWACNQKSRHAVTTASRALRLGADPSAQIPMAKVPEWDYNHNSPLLLAVKNGNTEIVELLVRYGADPCATSQRHTAVTLAAEKGDLESLACMMGGDRRDEEEGSAWEGSAWPRVPNSRRLDGLAALHLAAAEGRDEVVRFLVERRARLDIRDADGATPLHHAIRHGRRSTTQLLLDEHGADPMATDHGDNNCLDEAVLGAIRAAQTRRMGFEPNLRLDILRDVLGQRRLRRPGLHHDGRSVEKSHLAIPGDRAHRLLAPPQHMGNSIPVLQALLEAGIDVDARSAEDGGSTALWLLAGTPRDNGGPVDTEPGELLLDAGADIEARDRELGLTPLLRAAKAGRLDYLGLLLSRGADVSARSKAGQSVLVLAAAQSDNDAGDVTRLLLDHQTRRDGTLSDEMAGQLDLADDRGWTPLLASLDRMQFAAAQVLLDRGALLETRDAAGWTPLMHAVAPPGSSAESVRLLLRNGAEVDTVHECKEAADAAGAGSGAALRTRETPLVAAVTGGVHEIVRDLLKAGASVPLALECDPGLLDLCKHRKDVEMLDLLEGRGWADVVESVSDAVDAGESAEADRVDESDETESTGSWDIEQDGDPSTWVL